MDARFSYNGVEFREPLLTLSVRRTPVMDGPTYLYTAYEFHVRGCFHPAVYKELGGNDAGRVEENYRHLLMQPRAKMIYTVGDTTVIESPAAGFTVDCANGPLPRVNEIRELHGSQLMLVDAAYTTFINENEDNLGTGSVILSHRWTERDSFDDDLFQTRTRRGHAIFRSDRLAELKAMPDDFRSWLLPPEPKNFRRHIEVEVSEDGLELDYTVTDTEQPLNLIDPGVANIEVTHSQSSSRGGLEKLAMDTAWDVLGTIKDSFGSLSISPMIEHFGRQMERFKNMMPRLFTHLGVRVWGRPGTPRKYLEDVAFNFIASRLTPIAAVLSAVKSTVTHDVSGRFIQVDVEVESGPVYSIFQLGAGAILGIPRPYFADEEVPGILTARPANNPGLPVDKRTRGGSRTAKLVSAALMDSEDVPPKPAEPPSWKALSPP